MKKNKKLKKSEWLLLIPVEHIIGREYYCTWQTNTYSKFILKDIIGDTAIMFTKDHSREFRTNLKDLRDTHKNMKNEQFRREAENRATKRISKIMKNISHTSEYEK